MSVSHRGDYVELTVGVCTDIYDTATDGMDTLEQIQRYLSNSTHSEKQRERQDLGRCLEPILYVYRLALESALNLTWPELTRKDTAKGDQIVSERLTWEAVEKCANSCNENRTIRITVEKAYFQNLNNWETILQNICEQLRFSKAKKKRGHRKKFSRYAPGILRLNRALQSAYQNLGNAPTSGEVKGDLQGECVIKPENQDKLKEDDQNEKPRLPQSSVTSTASKEEKTPKATVFHSPLPSNEGSHSPQSEGKTGQNGNKARRSTGVEADANVAKDKERKSLDVEVHHIQVAERTKNEHDVVAEPDSERSRARQEDKMVATSAAAPASMEYTTSGNQEESTDLQRVSRKKKKDKVKEKSECMSTREKTLEEQKLNVEQWENKIAQRDKEVDARERELTDREEKLKQDETNQAQRLKDITKQYNEQLNQLTHQLQQQKKISEDLRQRLSKEMGVKISANESSVENISIKHRPMTIADNYVNFQSNEWYEAKVFVDEHLAQSSVEERVSVLSHILQITEGTVKGALNKLIEVLENALLQPATCAATEMKELSSLSRTNVHMFTHSLTGKLRSSLEKDTRSTVGHVGDFQKKLSPAVMNAIGDFLRVEVDNCDYKLLIKLTATQIAEKCKSIQSVITYEPIESYIAAMVRLCWMMTIQRPAMTFDFQRKRLNDKYQTLFWGSKVKEDAEVYVVHPILKHGDQVMSKGQIYLAEHQHSVATTV